MPTLRAPYETDWTGRFRGSTPAVVRPGSTAEVAAIVTPVPERAHRHRRPGWQHRPGGRQRAARGRDRAQHCAGWTSVEPVDRAAQQVTVGAGATVADVHGGRRARLGSPTRVDFGARDTATIGGSVATNAGGINVLRYGGTREQLSAWRRCWAPAT